MSETKNYTIAVLPGDGIGPDVTKEGMRVLREVESRLSGVSFQAEEFSVGAGEYLRSGDPLPKETFERIREFDAILLGAMGLPGVRWPTGVEMTPQIDLREDLDLYCGLRPIKLYHAEDSPLLRSRRNDKIDFAIIRENCEGLFYSRKRRPAEDASEVFDEMRISRASSERLFRSAFDLAKRGRGHVTLVDKANVLPSMAFFRKIFDEVAAGYPDIRTDKVYVDAMALHMVQKPEAFDVIVTENMFGDILLDLAAALIGGMGMAPSADIGDKHAVFQPSHGSAPDIAGKGIANPVATVLSVAMMLEWFNHPETLRGAGMIYNAVERVFASRVNRTADMGGRISTVEMGGLIVSSLPKS